MRKKTVIHVLACWRLLLSIDNVVGHFQYLKHHSRHFTHCIIIIQTFSMKTLHCIFLADLVHEQESYETDWKAHENTADEHGIICSIEVL